MSVASKPNRKGLLGIIQALYCNSYAFFDVRQNVSLFHFESVCHNLNKSSVHESQYVIVYVLGYQVLSKDVGYEICFITGFK